MSEEQQTQQTRERYDLIVVGSGGALVTLDRALAAGYRCALVEMGRFGGTCLTRGCIPTKVMTTAATLAWEARRGHVIGVDTADVRLNWPRISERVHAAIDQRFDVEAHYRGQANCTVYQGAARCESDGSLTIWDRAGELMAEIEGERIVIATGAHTRVDPLEGLEPDCYWTSETLFADDWPEQLPESLVIFGAGPIGCEFAHIFHEAGVRVTIVQRNVRLLPYADAEVSRHLLSSLQARGIEVYTDTVAQRVTRLDERRLSIDLRSRMSGEERTIEGERILLATGIIPHTALAPERAGIAVDGQGWIRINPFLETSRPGVWAIGDCTGQFPFRHVVNYQASLLADNLFPETRAPEEQGTGLRWARYDGIPYVTFSLPEVAHCGLTTDEAEASGRRYRITERHYSDNAKGQAMGLAKDSPEDGYVRLIIDDGEEPGRLLGAHIIGPEASVLLQPFLVLLSSWPSRLDAQPVHEEMLGSEAARARMAENAIRQVTPGTVWHMNETMTPHPALSEVSFWAVSELGGAL